MILKGNQGFLTANRERVYFAFFLGKLREKKIAMNDHNWNLMTTCRGRSYPHNLTKKGGREGEEIVSECPKLLRWEALGS